MLVPSETRHAKHAVDSFYSHEQRGDFSDSWELFHPLMKKKFSKGDYIEDRAHVFMSHFGVETFDYSLTKPKKVEDWRMSEEEEFVDVVYKVTVTQKYQSKYGRMNLVQDVYVAEEDGEWLVIWDYQ